MMDVLELQNSRWELLEFFKEINAKSSATNKVLTRISIVKTSNIIVAS